MSATRAWAFSLALHVLLLAAALGLGRMSPDQAEILRWKVALVASSAARPLPPVAPPEPRTPTRPPSEAPRRVAAPADAAPPPQATATPAAAEAEPPAQVATLPAPVKLDLPRVAAGGAPGSAEPVTPALTSIPTTTPARARAAAAPEKLWYAALVERLGEHRRYPTLARRLGQEGVVALEIRVDPDGSLRELTLLRSSGFPSLDRAAQELVRQATEEVRSQLRPERSSHLEIPVAYRLRD